MFNFDSKNHTAVKVCITKADYYDNNHLSYSSQEELKDIPEFEAYNSCRKAWAEAMNYIPRDMAKQIRREARAWMKSTIDKLDMKRALWTLDDTSSGCPNVFASFCPKGTLTIRIDEYFDLEGKFIHIESNEDQKGPMEFVGSSEMVSPDVMEVQYKDPITGEVDIAWFRLI